MATIDTLQIKIESDTSKAVSSIKKLSEALNSLKSGNKISDTTKGLEEMGDAAEEAGEGAERAGDGLNAASVNMSSFIYNIKAVVQGLKRAVEAFAELTKGAIEWDGITYQFGNSFGEQADEYYEKIVKITDALNLDKQTFMENTAMATSMLIGYGVDKADAREMGLGYTELAYDIWAAFNNVYKGFDDSMTAIRSAIAGEVEPIRRAGFTIVDSQLAITAANHGIAYSTKNASEELKSYLRYLSLVDQAQNKGVVGAYINEMHTAEGLIRTLRQQLTSLSNEFGALFIPVLARVVPYMQAFVELLGEGVYWLANLFGVEIQKVDFSGFNSGASAVGGLSDAMDDATKSAKALKSATIGIDELNVINPNSGGGGGAAGGGGGVGGLDVESIWDQALLDQIEMQVDGIKEKVRSWIPLIAVVAAAFAGLTIIKLLGQLGEAIFWTRKLFTNFAELTGLAAVAKTFKTISSAIGSISAATLSIIAVAVAGIAAAAYFLSQNWEKVTQAVRDFFDENVSPRLSKIKDSVEKVVKAFQPLADVFRPIIEKVKELLVNFDLLPVIGKAIEVIGGFIFTNITEPIAGTISLIATVIENVVQLLGGFVRAAKGTVSVIAALFGKGDIKAAVEDYLTGLGDFYGGLFGLVYDSAKATFDGVLDWFKALFENLTGITLPQIIGGIVGFFKNLPTLVGEALGVFNDGVLLSFSDLWEGVKSWWKNSVAPKFTKEYWVDKFKGLKDGFVETIKNMINVGIDKMNSFIRTLNQKMSFSWPAVPALNIEAGSIQLFTIPEIPKVYANGGIIEDGLFTMNRGEMAGKFDNGRSVVANNEMIVDGIAAGVYQAVVSAMTETNGGGGQSVNVYLDGKQIYASVKRVESERGRTLMGNQLGYSY